MRACVRAPCVRASPPWAYRSFVALPAAPHRSLGLCINALSTASVKADGSGGNGGGGGASVHVPYRNSKLTHLLHDCLGGNCRTSMLFGLSPALFRLDESLSTLRFAMRAKKIQTAAKVNVKQVVYPPPLSHTHAHPTPPSDAIAACFHPRCHLHYPTPRAFDPTPRAFDPTPRAFTPTVPPACRWPSPQRRRRSSFRTTRGEGRRCPRVARPHGSPGSAGWGWPSSRRPPRRRWAVRWAVRREA